MKGDKLTHPSDEALPGEVRRGATAPSYFLRQQELLEVEVRPGVRGALAAPLPPEQIQRLLVILETRFKNTPPHYNSPGFLERRGSTPFIEIRAALEDHPELMRELAWMEATGGQPDFWGEAEIIDDFRTPSGWNKTGIYYRLLCSSRESPEGRRNHEYTQVERAMEENCPHGLVVSGKILRIMNQAAGKGMGMGFTRDSADWISSSHVIEEYAHAMKAIRIGDRTCLSRCEPHIASPHRGWRIELRIPKKG